MKRFYLSIVVLLISFIIANCSSKDPDEPAKVGEGQVEQTRNKDEEPEQDHERERSGEETAGSSRAGSSRTSSSRKTLNKKQKPDLASAQTLKDYVAILKGSHWQSQEKCSKHFNDFGVYVFDEKKPRIYFLEKKNVKNYEDKVEGVDIYYDFPYQLSDVADLKFQDFNGCWHNLKFQAPDSGDVEYSFYDSYLGIEFRPVKKIVAQLVFFGDIIIPGVQECCAHYGAGRLKPG